MGWRQTVRQQDRVKGTEGELLGQQRKRQDQQSPKTQAIQMAKPPSTPAAEGVPGGTLYMDSQSVNLPEVDPPHFPFFHETRRFTFL